MIKNKIYNWLKVNRVESKDNKKYITVSEFFIFNKKIQSGTFSIIHTVHGLFVIDSKYGYEQLEKVLNDGIFSFSESCFKILVYTDVDCYVLQKMNGFIFLKKDFKKVETKRINYVVS